MRQPAFAFFVLTAVVAGLWRTDAHHSFGATYLTDKEISVEGVVVQIALRSPHSFFYVEAADASGELRRWSIEAAAASQMMAQGVDRQTFKVGDKVVVIGNPARSADSFRARLIKITRLSDGKSWGAGPGEVVR